MSDHAFTVLFVCADNSSRSLMAASLLTSIGKGRFVALSGGDQPATAIDPHAIETLSTAGLPLASGIPQHWRDAAAGHRVDLVVTLTGEGEPAINVDLPNHPIVATWPVPQPAAGSDNRQEIVLAYAATMRQLRRPIEVMAELPMTQLDRLAIQDEIDGLHKP